MGLHTGEIDDDRSIWVLPAARTKNGREHLVPLSPLARRLLSEIEPNEEGYVFSSRLKGLPYRGQSIDHATRYLFNPRPVAKTRRRTRLSERPTAPPLLAGVIDRFVPHDLRRTVATRMRELGISRGDVKMVLNHVESDVTARYDRYDGLAEKKRALDLWSRRLEQIVSGKESSLRVYSAEVRSAFPKLMSPTVQENLALLRGVFKCAGQHSPLPPDPMLSPIGVASERSTLRKTARQDIVDAVRKHYPMTEGKLIEAVRGELLGHQISGNEIVRARNTLFGAPGRTGRPRMQQK